jgi:hypothetical protein
MAQGKTRVLKHTRVVEYKTQTASERKEKQRKEDKKGKYKDKE